MLIVGSNFQHVSSTSQWLFGKTSWNISKLHLKFIIVRHIGILLLPEQSVVITTAQMTTHLSAWQTRPSNVHLQKDEDVLHAGYTWKLSALFLTRSGKRAMLTSVIPARLQWTWPLRWAAKRWKNKMDQTAMTGVMARGKWYSWRWHKCWWRIYNNGRVMSCFLRSLQFCQSLFDITVVAVHFFQSNWHKK